jgi:hypothetical protein
LPRPKKPPFRQKGRHEFCDALFDGPQPTRIPTQGAPSITLPLTVASAWTLTPHSPNGSRSNLDCERCCPNTPPQGMAAEQDPRAEEGRFEARREGDEQAPDRIGDANRTLSATPRFTARAGTTRPTTGTSSAYGILERRRAGQGIAGDSISIKFVGSGAADTAEPRPPIISAPCRWSFGAGRFICEGVHGGLDPRQKRKMHHVRRS